MTDRQLCINPYKLPFMGLAVTTVLLGLIAVTCLWSKVPVNFALGDELPHLGDDTTSIPAARCQLGDKHAIDIYHENNAYKNISQFFTQFAISCLENMCQTMIYQCKGKEQFLAPLHTFNLTSIFNTTRLPNNGNTTVTARCDHSQLITLLATFGGIGFLGTVLVSYVMIKYCGNMKRSAQEAIENNEGGMNDNYSEYTRLN